MTTKTLNWRKEKLSDAGDEWEMIHRATQAEGLDDGGLIAVASKLKRGAGYRSAVGLTETVYEKCVRSPAKGDRQDETRRLWDILVRTRVAFQTAPNCPNVVPVNITIANNDGTSELVILKAIWEPGAGPWQAVTTIMFPGEE